MSARMTTNDDKAFQAPPQPRQPPYHLLVPILYAPVRLLELGRCLQHNSA